MELRLGSSGKKEAEDEPTKGSLAGGCCFDFNKVSPFVGRLLLQHVTAHVRQLD